MPRGTEQEQRQGSFSERARVALEKYLDARKGMLYVSWLKGLHFLDFSDVLLAEPSNAAAQEEMKKLTILIQRDKEKVLEYYVGLPRLVFRN